MRTRSVSVKTGHIQSNAWNAGKSRSKKARKLGSYNAYEVKIGQFFCLQLSAVSIQSEGVQHVRLISLLPRFPTSELFSRL
jgi:hypothetical protein